MMLAVGAQSAIAPPPSLLVLPLRDREGATPVPVLWSGVPTFWSTPLAVVTGGAGGGEVVVVGTQFEGVVAVSAATGERV